MYLSLLKYTSPYCPATKWLVLKFKSSREYNRRNC